MRRLPAPGHPSPVLFCSRITGGAKPSAASDQGFGANLATLDFCHAQHMRPFADRPRVHFTYPCPAKDTTPPAATNPASMFRRSQRYIFTRCPSIYSKRDLCRGGNAPPLGEGPYRAGTGAGRGGKSSWGNRALRADGSLRQRVPLRPDWHSASRAGHKKTAGVSRSISSWQRREPRARRPLPPSAHVPSRHGHPSPSAASTPREARLLIAPRACRAPARSRPQKPDGATFPARYFKLPPSAAQVTGPAPAETICWLGASARGLLKAGAMMGPISPGAAVGSTVEGTIASIDPLSSCGAVFWLGWFLEKLKRRGGTGRTSSSRASIPAGRTPGRYLTLTSGAIAGEARASYPVRNEPPGTKCLVTGKPKSHLPGPKAGLGRRLWRQELGTRQLHTTEPQRRETTLEGLDVTRGNGSTRPGM